MKPVVAVICVMLAAVVIGASAASYKDCDTVWKGCKVEDKMCVCSTIQDCENPFQYEDKADCMKDMYGDVCESNPCKNGGLCLQLSHKEYRCQCSGTGFYGKHCQKECKTKSHSEDVACVF
ncbi:delta-like protein 4 [Ptychodera flava]|uniref:delta-like protein 4 n=1 Tax=Ptychodera flava TaxID=63121 RepID=UPI00396A2306